MTSPYLLRMFESFTENKVIIPESSLYDTVLIIALGQLTGWSADKISTTLYNSSKIEVTANQIWRFNYKFLLERKTGAVFNEEEMQTMQLVARNNGVPEELLRCRGVGVKKLTSTTAPIDMEFFQTGDQSTFCNLYTTDVRKSTFAHLLTSQDMDKYSELAPLELPVIEQFGSEVEKIFRGVLRCWGMYLMRAEAKRHAFAEVGPRTHCRLVHHHLDIFHSRWEQEFGILDYGSLIETFEDGGVRIVSTGYAVKLLLGMMMSERLVALRELKKQALENMPLLTALSPRDIPEDSKCCAICQEDIGVGDTAGIRMDLCCKQIVGNKCLLRWLRDEDLHHGKTTCPCCRFEVPPRFTFELHEATGAVDRPRLDEDYLVDLEARVDPSSPVEEDEDLIGLEAFEHLSVEDN